MGVRLFEPFRRRPSRRSDASPSPSPRATGPRQRRLAFESLEDRRLLATLNLDVQLWTVDAADPNQKGSPIPAVETAPIKVFDVPLGATFFAQVVVDDERAAGDPMPDSAGVVSLPLDLAWNVAGPTVIGFSAAPPPLFPLDIPRENPIVTSQFPQQRFVTAFDTAAGATNLRGATIPQPDGTTPIGQAGCNPPGGQDDCREFSLLQFDALAPGESRFVVSLAGAMSFADAAQLDNDPTVEVVIRVFDEPPPTGLSSLSGFVYIDIDNDGVRDLDAIGTPIELGIPNVEIQLFRQGEAVPLRQTVTGPDGSYQFENLPPGAYDVRQIQPECFIDGQETLGIVLPGQVARGQVADDAFLNIVLDEGEHGIDYNFGELGLRPECISKNMFRASSPPGKEAIATTQGIASVTVRGTEGDDNISFERVGGVVRVTVGSAPVQEFPLSAAQIVWIDGGGGENTVTLNGTDADEIAQMQPRHGTLRDDVVSPLPDGGTRHVWQYAVEVVNASHIRVNAGGGTDLAILRDSTGNDQLTASGDSADLSWLDGVLTGRAAGFDKVRAISILGGSDTVNEQAHDFVLELLGDWE